MKRNITLLVCCCMSLSSYTQIWNTMATGLGSGTEFVKAIAENPINHEIFAAGNFTSPVSYIAKWNGTAWEQLGTGVNGPVNALAFKNGELYVGGSFTLAGGVTVSNVAKWASGAWSDVGGGFNGEVKCLFTSPASGTVHAGGTFTLSGSTSVNHIAKLVSTSWTALGSGIGGVVNAITEHNGAIHAGSEILTNPVHKFDGTNWSTVSGISGGSVFALASFQNYLYAGGDFTSPFFAAVKHDGTSWQSIVTTFSSSDRINALYKGYNNILYIGGNFVNLGIPTARASYAAKILSYSQPIQSITLTSSTLSNEVFAISSQSYKPVVGGQFATPASNIAITSASINIDELSSLIKEKNFFPNPVVNKATIKIVTTEKLKEPGLKIFDVISRKTSNAMFEMQTDGNTIEYVVDCSELPPANYYYTVMDGEKSVISDTFIKE